MLHGIQIADNIEHVRTSLVPVLVQAGILRMAARIDEDPFATVGSCIVADDSDRMAAPSMKKHLSNTYSSSCPQQNYAPCIMK